MKVSVIVPVYNMEITVSRCLDSIVGQDYKDFEVILINDGSNDKSPEICKDYVRRYGNIRYFSRENKGLPYTIKEGLDHSISDFVTFVDSDDYVEPNLLSTLVKAQKEVDADIVQSGIAYIGVDGSLKSEFKMKNSLITDKSKIFHAYFIEKSVNNTMASALFRKKLFEDIPFSQDLLSIDIQVMPLVLTKFSVFRQIEDVLYNAVQYPNSVSRGARIDKMYEDRKKRNILLESFFSQHAPELGDYMLYRKSMDSLFLYDKIRTSGDDIEENILKKIKEECRQCFRTYYPKLLNSNLYIQFDKKDKIKLKLFSISPQLYICIMGLYEKWMNRNTNY